MSAHSKTPFINPSMDFFLWERGSTGEQGAAAGIHLCYSPLLRTILISLDNTSNTTRFCTDEHTWEEVKLAHKIT